MLNSVTSPAELITAPSTIDAWLLFVAVDVASTTPTATTPPEELSTFDSVCVLEVASIAMLPLAVRLPSTETVTTGAVVTVELFTPTAMTPPPEPLAVAVEIPSPLVGDSELSDTPPGPSSRCTVNSVPFRSSRSSCRSPTDADRSTPSAPIVNSLDAPSPAVTSPVMGLPAGVTASWKLVAVEFFT